MCCIFTKNNNFQVNFYAETIQLTRKEFYEWPPFYVDRKPELTKTAVVFIDKVCTSLRVIYILFVGLSETEFDFFDQNTERCVNFKHFFSLGIAIRQCRRFDRYI